MVLKKLTAVAVSAALIFSLSSCATRHNAEDAGKMQVAVTFNAMKQFAQAVGRDKIAVYTVIPDGTEPHDFEVKAKDLVQIGNAKVFVYSGMGMEAWVSSALSSVGNGKLVACDASKGIKPIVDTGSAESTEHGQYDPHVWISLKSAETETRNITVALTKADPKNRTFYNKNASAYIRQLQALYTNYKGKFKALNKKNFVTGHAAFAYLCRDFGLSQNSVEDVFAEGEPSAKRLRELIDYCKQKKVKTVFVETMVSPAVSKTLASSVGARVETIYTIESSEGGKSYLDRMKQNLREIYDSLK